MAFAVFVGMPTLHALPVTPGQERNEIGRFRVDELVYSFVRNPNAFQVVIEASGDQFWRKALLDESQNITANLGSLELVSLVCLALSFGRAFLSPVG